MMRNKTQIKADILSLQERGYALPNEDIRREIDLMVILCNDVLSKGQLTNANKYLDKCEELVSKLERNMKL